MNDLNAIMFALIGSVMELLPVIFPAWFPRDGGDLASTRGLWLDIMGVVQIGLGAGYIVRAHFVPATLRIFSAIPAGERESLALANPRAVAGR
jgi:hypothetical protein